jgi:acetolactate synthase-1/2/3 large subunit
MKVTDVLVHCLENEGVEYVFGIVGKETIDLADSLSRSKQIQFVNVRHEQGAAFMADVYGRLSKKVGVCFSTLGPGATNLLTGISSAQLDHSPVVAIMGQAGVERHHKESHQYIDLVKVFEPVTKWSTQIKDAMTVPAVIRKAFRITKMEKTGSVAIILPENFAAQTIPDKPLPVTSIPESVPSQDAIKDAITHSFKAKGVLPKYHPLNFFTFGFNENDEVLSGIDEADLLIVIGFDFVEKLPKDWNKKKTPVLHIDALPTETNEYYPVEVELVGNIKKTLHLLNQSEIPAKSWIPSGNLQEKIKTAYQIKKPNSQTLTIENVLHYIETYFSENTIVISDVGAHKVSIARTYQPKMPNRLIISNGLATMGIAIPGSIGAKLACPHDTVICITGDGGALMNFAEIETAKRLGLSFIIIVLNDSMLKLEVQQMNKKFGKSYGVTFQNPDFVQLAESFGIKGIRVSNLGELENILKETLQYLEEIVLIDVTVQN